MKIELPNLFSCFILLMISIIQYIKSNKQNISRVEFNFLLRRTWHFPAGWAAHNISSDTSTQITPTCLTFLSRVLRQDFFNTVEQSQSKTYWTEASTSHRSMSSSVVRRTDSSIFFPKSLSDALKKPHQEGETSIMCIFSAF